jgi:hypothetical protein
MKKVFFVSNVVSEVSEVSGKCTLSNKIRNKSPDTSLDFPDTSDTSMAYIREYLGFEKNYVMFFFKICYIKTHV